MLKRGEPRDDGRPNTTKPFDEDTTVEDVHAHAWPDPDKLDYSRIRPDLERWYGRYATCGAPWSPFFHEVGWLLGQENYFVWMHTKPDVVEAVTAHIVDYEIEVSRRFLDACGGMLDIAYVGNDFGTQRGLFVGPKHFQRFIRPFLKRFYDLFHEYGCIVMQHSCGAIRDAIPWMIEDGVDVLDPVQVNAEGMALDSLIADFGDRLAFHGGVDTQQLLPFGTPREVRETVRAYREWTADRGGYILSGSQNYIEDIPLENILAVYDENMKLCNSAVVA
jgi:uroporphyrinogen decarboxylase